LPSPSDGPSVRVLIADDHRLMREGTAALLEADPRISVVGLARDGAEAVGQSVALTPDVVLLDLNMPGVGGIEACAELRARLPATQVLMLTVSEHEEDLYAALRMGASGYLLKDMPPHELVEAILRVGGGEPQIAPRMAVRLLADLTVPSRPPPPPIGADRASKGMVDDTLSEREQEVLALLAEGLRNREIADRLFITEATVKTHVRHILEKLQFRNRAEAAAYAARRQRPGG
jgi:two-component system NarL family response regulator